MRKISWYYENFLMKWWEISWFCYVFMAPSSVFLTFSWEISHNIIILRFCNIVEGQAKWFHLLNSVLFISVWVHAIWIYMHQSALLWINKFLATDIYEFLIISYNVGRKFNISLMFPSGPPLSRICSITKKMPSWNPMMLWWFPVDRSHKALTLKRLCCDSIKA